MRYFKTILFFFLISLAHVADAYEAQSDVRINQLLNSVAGLSPPEKIVKLSGELLSVPYQLEPAGEGPYAYFNQEPLYRLDKFDCETFVNTVVALALSNNIVEFHKNICLINYKDGVVSFKTRDHFTDADWLVNNTHNGFVKNVSSDIAGNSNVATASALIDRKSWYQYLPLTRIHVDHLSTKEQMARLKQLHQLSHDMNNVEAHIVYIPSVALLGNDIFLANQTEQNNQISHVAAHSNSTALLTTNKSSRPRVNIEDIPNGAIILIVRPNVDMTKSIGTHLNVVHMGFAIWQDGILEFRAASSIHQKVIDIPLLQYLQVYSHFHSASGISVITLTS